MRTVDVRRDGPFVRIDLPAPGKWVVVMRPAVAQQLAQLIESGAVGPQDCDGVKVRISRFTHYTRIKFDKWSGQCDLTPKALGSLVLDLRREAFSVGNPAPCTLL